METFSSSNFVKVSLVSHGLLLLGGGGGGDCYFRGSIEIYIITQVILVF